MVAVRQTSFRGGEYAPTIWGRFDTPEYAVGLKTLKNYFVSKHAAAVSRPGTTLVRKTANSGIGNEKVRLVPFSLSDSVSYVLELGHLYMRVHQNGYTLQADGLLTDGPNDASPLYQISSPFGADDLDRLKFIQVGGVMFFATPDKPAYELIRFAITDWQFFEMDFTPQAYDGKNPSFFINGVTPYAFAPLPTESATEKFQTWELGVTMILERVRDGLKIETAMKRVTKYREYIVDASGNFTASPPGVALEGDIPRKLAIYPDKPFEVFTADQGFFGVTNLWRCVSTRLYRGKGKVFGFIGEAPGPQLNPDDIYKSGIIEDIGLTPLWTEPPPEGTNPFQLVDSTGAPVGDPENPYAIGFFEGRLVFGGTLTRPNQIFISASNNYYDFDKRYVATANGPMADIRLGSRKFEQIRAILGMENLLAFTDAGVWIVGTRDGTVLSPLSNASARVASDVGIGDMDPLVLPNAILYVRSKGRGVRDLQFDDNRGGYAGGDMSYFASHLFDGGELGIGNILKSWCYAEDPWGVVWAARNDGKFLSLTYSNDPAIAAWAYHETQGNVKSFCSVPEGNEDAVYMVVRRTHGQYIERMTSRKTQPMTDYILTDSTIVYQGAEISVITGLDHLNGETVKGLADGDIVGPFIVSSGQVTLPRPASRVTIGLPYNCDLRPLAVAHDRIKDKDVNRILVDVEESRAFYAGQDESTLTRVQDLASGQLFDNPILPYSGPVDMSILGGWGRDGDILIRQSDPVPLIILSIIRDTEFGA